MKFAKLVLAITLASVLNNVILLALQGRVGELTYGGRAALAWLNAPAWGAPQQPGAGSSAAGRV